MEINGQLSGLGTADFQRGPAVEPDSNAVPLCRYPLGRSFAEPLS